MKTEHLTVRTTDAHFSCARHLVNGHALSQDELSIRVCIFSKVLLSTCSVSLILLLSFLPRWLRKQAQPAPIHGIVHGLAAKQSSITFHGHARNKLQFPTAVLNQAVLLSMLECEWARYLPIMFGAVLRRIFVKLVLVERCVTVLHSESLVHSIDHVPVNVPSSNKPVHGLVCEGNEAVIKVIIMVRSPKMRHVSRTHRVDWDWFFGRVIWIRHFLFGGFIHTFTVDRSHGAHLHKANSTRRYI